MGEPRAPSLITTHDALSKVAARLERVDRFALDLESNGMFAYRATLCVLQIAEGHDIWIVDTLAAPIDALAPLLAAERPRKIIHDVAFDARLLVESGAELAGVDDTAIAARMLGRSATGLGSLLGSELDVRVDKRMQHHDWAKRPLDGPALSYLASDVRHLSALADKLFAEVQSVGIGDEVEEETLHRLRSAKAAGSAPESRPAWARVKRFDRLPRADLGVLRELALLREREAARRNVPPFKVLAPDLMLDIARKKPSDLEALSKLRPARAGKGDGLARKILEAVKAGVDAEIPEDERSFLERPRVAPEVHKRRRDRETKLVTWRRGEAKRRGVDEQVVLPGHCVHEIADLGAPTRDAIASVDGFGKARAARYAETIAALLAEGDAPE
jgi:ribonuclease D